MKNKILLVSLLLAFNVHADDVKPMAKTDFIQQTDNSFAEEIRMDGEIKRLEKQAQILNKRNEIAKLAPGINSASYGVPYVKAVEGIDKKYTALIIFGNGVEYESAVGDTLPNGMKVTRVAPGDVRVKSGTSDYRLGFINPSQVPSEGSGNAGIPNTQRY